MAILVNKKIWVPFDLALKHPEVYRGTMVFMAISSIARNGHIGVMSLNDIIYLIGMTPTTGKNRTNYKIAQTINQLRELGYLETAPDYFASGERISPKIKRGYKIAPRPRKSRDYAMVTSKTVHDFCNLARISHYHVDGEEHDRLIRFSTDVAVRTYFYIRKRIFDSPSNVAFIQRGEISGVVGVSQQTITETTACLNALNFIRKRSVYHKDSPDGEAREMNYYTICSKDEKDTQERLDKEIRNYWKSVLDARDKADDSDSSWGEKPKDWAAIEAEMAG